MGTLTVLGIIVLGMFILSYLLSIYTIVGLVIFHKDLEKPNADIIGVLTIWPYLLWIKRKPGKRITYRNKEDIMPNTYLTQNELDVLVVSISQTKRNYEEICAYYEECIKGNDEDCDRYKGKLARTLRRIKEIDDILPKLRRG